MALKFNSYYIYSFSSFASFSDRENELYEERKKGDTKARTQLENSLSDISLQRTIRKSALQIREKDGSLKLKSVSGIFENELLRWIMYNRKDHILRIAGDKKLIKGVAFFEIAHNTHNGILQSIINNGVLIDGKEYRLFTAGAGQQRDNQVTLLEKSILNEFRSWYACGLTDELINARDGMNTGKYLAYCALPLSSSKPIEIDINKVVVVSDLKITLDKEVEYIDTKTFDSRITTLKELDKQLTQTDGAGMILPSALQEIEKQLGLDYVISGFQIRGPWIKGALFPFDFEKFCLEKGSCVLTDIYNNEHDVIAEGIQVILTASQFKAWRLYKGWDEYKQHFKANALHFSVTKVSDLHKDISEINYQFLQTLDRDKASPAAITALCAKSIAQLKALRHDKNTVLEAFGAVATEPNLKPLQAALLLYPSLLTDEKIKKELDDKIRGRKKKYRAGRLLMDGFYGYAMPDFYAFCEFLFEGIKDPSGIIPSNSIYCNHYRDHGIHEVDCLRAPHLGNEHVLRRLHQSTDCAKWFEYCGSNIITSIRDYLMILGLTGDYDGDTIFITPERCIIDLVKPHTVLYYDMPKATEQEVTSDNVYKTLVSSFACNDYSEGNTIGCISNTQTKIWNTAKFTDEMSSLIKYLVVLNNHVIDYPKSQQALLLPKEIRSRYDEMRVEKLPYFFKWVKGKEEEDVNPPTKSPMNLITKCIDAVKNLRYSYCKGELDFDYSVLQRRLDTGEIYGVNRYGDEYRKIHDTCKRLGKAAQRIKREIKRRSYDKDVSRPEMLYNLQEAIYREELIKLCSDEVRLANTLVDIHYNQPSVPNMHNFIWRCFGEVILESIRLNADNPSYTPQERARKAYNTSKVIPLIKEAEKQIEQRKAIIYKCDLEHIREIENEKIRKVYFALLVKAKHNKRHTVILASSPKHLNKTKLAKLAGLVKKKEVINPNTKRKKTKWNLTINMKDVFAALREQRLIDIDRAPKKGEIISLPKYNFRQRGEVALTIEPDISPSVYYAYLFEGKEFGTCQICGKLYAKEGNMKTCNLINSNCSQILEKWTKDNLNRKAKKLKHSKSLETLVC